MDQKAIFSIGNSKFDFGLVREIAEKEGSAAIKVLDRQDVQPSHGRINFEDLYARAKEAIDEADVGPDAIIGDLDFPVTSLVSLLR